MKTTYTMDESIRLYLSKEDKNIIKAAAKKHRLTLSAYVRQQLLRNIIEKELNNG